MVRYPRYIAGENIYGAIDLVNRLRNELLRITRVGSKTDW